MRVADEPPSTAAGGATGSAPKNVLMPFIVISISYLLFTITDGGVRMIVLLHAYNQGFTAMVRRPRRRRARVRGGNARARAGMPTSRHATPSDTACRKLLSCSRSTSSRAS